MMERLWRMLKYRGTSNISVYAAMGGSYLLGSDTPWHGVIIIGAAMVFDELVTP